MLLRLARVLRVLQITTRQLAQRRVNIHQQLVPLVRMHHLQALASNAPVGSTPPEELLPVTTLS